MREPPFLDALRRLLPPGADTAAEQMGRAANVLLQGAVNRLDVVPREEFEAQALVLARTRQQVEQLERQVAELAALLEAQSGKA